MLSNYIPPYNSTVVQRLTNSGAILVGKTNLDEFGMGSGGVDSYFGPTKNPWKSPLERDDTDSWYITGGSSSGSAVSVATKCAIVAIGSDTGG